MNGSVFRAGLSGVTTIIVYNSSFTSFSFKYRVDLVIVRLTSGLLDNLMLSIDRVRVQNVGAINLIVIHTIFVLCRDARFPREDR